MTVAEFIAKELRKFGIEMAFGIPGGEVATILEALHREGIEFVLASHEAGAAFMADAYYRRTGKIPLVLATLGPGATNAVAGAAQAYLDRSPLVFMTGAVSTRVNDVYPHQILDHGAMFRPVTKWSEQLTPQNVRAIMARAGVDIQSYPPGPIHLDLPVDAALEMLIGDVVKAPAIVPHADDAGSLRKILDMIGASDRPIFVVGLEAADHETAGLLRAVVNRQKIPVFTTYKAKGVLDERHPLSLGALGLSPMFDQIAVECLREADVTIALGVDPVELRSDWLDVWPELRVIGIGQNPYRFPGFPPALAWTGHPAAFLKHLDGLSPKARDPVRDSSFQMARTRQGARWDAAEIWVSGIAPSVLAPHQVLRVVDEECADAVITIDTGAMRIAANHLIHASHPNRVLQSNGLGTMGYALPAAIGAQIADPDERVVALTGDAGLSMLMGELSTAAARQLPIVIVVFVDQSLALIDLKQSRMNYHHVGVDVYAPNFAGIAENYGGMGWIPGTVEEFRSQLQTALNTRDRLTIIHVPIDPMVYDALM